jgi:hypothetical protein
VIAALPLLGGAMIAAALGDLTVPPDRLPSNCALSPTSTVRTGNQLRSGLWASLPISSNPATSSEPGVVVAIRERIEGPRVTPDPPALSQRSLARFRMQLAEGIDEGYAAVYLEADSQDLIVVYGLRFEDAGAAAEFWKGAAAAKNPRLTGVLAGAMIAVATGPRGACLTAVGAHVKSALR